jgi:hypothetical protein
MPRFSMHSVMTEPVYSALVMTWALMYGSSIFVDVHHLGQLAGVVHVQHLAVGARNDVAHVGHGGDHRHVELALQPLLDDLHVQQAQEAAAETEAERGAALGRPGEAGIVQLQLLHGIAQLLVLVGIHREDAGPHHGFHILEAVDGLGCRGGPCG